jgi:ribose transport system ATP-binding protein
MTSDETLLAASGLRKSYGANTVLEGVDFTLRPGEVHALVGENGAGKSTLARILAGLARPDAGAMTFEGKPFAPRSRHEAERLGVRMVMQELNVIGTLTVAENVFIDQMPHRFGWIDVCRMNEEARALLAQLGLGDLDPSRPVGTLGIGHQQMVEIAAGLSRRGRVWILDEPTAALTDPEAEKLFAQVKLLQQEGVGILYISHRLEEIRRLSDRITVLRDGRRVATHRTSEVTLDQMIREMVGRELGESLSRGAAAPGAPALRVEGLCRGEAVRDVSFEAFHGEILGFAGLMGSGRTETMRAVFGADRADRGAVYLRGSAQPARICSPRDAVRQGLALLTEDRKGQGLLQSLSIRANTTLARMGDVARKGGWISSAAEQEVAERFVRTLGIRCTSAEQPVGQLSGGNQQKVVIAKWLYRDCDVLIFDEPTRGIDVGAKFEIYRLLADLAAGGKAVIVVSSDLKELMILCDRIAVMSACRLAAILGRGEWSQDKIMKAALSGYLGPSAKGAVN